jgi:hypothetical protein
MDAKIWDDVFLTDYAKALGKELAITLTNKAS